MSRSLLVLVATACIIAGCASNAADGQESAPDALCRQASTWASTPAQGVAQILPDETSEEGGRSYRFELDGRGGLQQLQADCGWGTYAECTFQAVRMDGRAFGFSDLSTFGVWERDGQLYLLYRIVDPKNEVDKPKRRLVRIDDPPVELCNQIGDYSDLM